MISEIINHLKMEQRFNFKRGLLARASNRRTLVVLQLVLVLRLAHVRAGDGYTSVRLVIGGCLCC